MSSNKNRLYNRLVNCQRWRRLRNYYLSQKPLCEICEKEGMTEPAVVVHHIKPIEDYLNNPAFMEALAYDVNNLQALCNKCHVQVHIDLKSKSKESSKKRNKQLTDLFVKKFFTGENSDKQKGEQQ